MELFGKIVEVFKLVFRTTDDTTADPTKHAQITLEPNASTTYEADRTIQLPEGDQDHVIVSKDSDDVLENKSLDSTTTEVQDTTDTTKKLKLDLTGITTATTRTQVVQDTNDTFVMRNTADTLQNKSLTSPELTGNISGDAFLDEDDMASDSPTKLASQQSIKKYTDDTAAAVQGNLQAHLDDLIDAHDASAISVNAAAIPGIDATDVQAALAELDSEKYDKTGGTISGNVEITGDLDMDSGNINDVASVNLNIGGTVDTEAAGQLNIGTANANAISIGKTGITTTVEGNLTVQGTTTTLNTQTLDVEDKNIAVNNNSDTASAPGSGLTIKGDSSLDIEAIEYTPGSTTSGWSLRKDIQGTDTSHEIVTVDHAQELTAKTLTTPKINEAVDLTATSTELNQLGGVTVGGTASGDIVTTDGDQDLSNKSLDSTTTEVQDTTDPTKKLKLDVSGVTTGTTRTQVVQDADDTFVMRDTTDTLTNKTLDAPILSTTASGGAIEQDLINNTPLTETNRLASEKAIVDFVNNQVAGVAGGSGSGEINYVTNPTFNTDASDWTTYKSTTTPPIAADTDNGSATEITFTRSTDYIIEGTASGRLQKSTANSARFEGISTDFSIPAGQQRRTTKVKFSYFTADTVAWNQLYVYLVRDPAGSPTIEELPTERLVQASTNSNTKKYEYESSFFPTVADYRLVIHIGTSTASSFTYYFDSFVIGPEEATRVSAGKFDNLLTYPGGANLDGWSKYDSSGQPAPTAYGQLTPSDASNVNLVRGPFALINSYTTMNSNWSGATVGKGITTEFTLPQGYVNRLLTLEFDYLEADNPSGTSGAEFGVYLVGEDNTVVKVDDITLSGTASTTDVINFRGTCVLPSSQDYRLAIHRQNNTGTSITLAFDTAYLGVGAPGNIAQVPLATSDAPGIVQVPKVIHSLSGTGTNGGYTDVGVDTIDLAVGTWILEIGVAKRITYSGTLNTDYGAQLAVSIHDAADNFIGSGATSACARSSSSANRLRGQVVNTTVVDVTSPITINLVARIIVENFGATITELAYFSGYIKATKIA